MLEGKPRNVDIAIEFVRYLRFAYSWLQARSAFGELLVLISERGYALVP